MNRKSKKSQGETDDDMLPDYSEYMKSGGAVRGRFAGWFENNAQISINGVLMTKDELFAKVRAQNAASRENKPAVRKSTQRSGSVRNRSASTPQKPTKRSSGT